MSSLRKGIQKMKTASIVLALLLMLFSVSACKCDNSDYYSTPNTYPTAHADGQNSSLDKISAPPLGNGEYSMLCTFRQTAAYSDGEYGMETRWDMKSWYDFTAETTEKGLRLKFTIARRSYVYGNNDESTVVFDTADEKTRDPETQIYFDLVGHSFTVDFDKEYNIISVGGTKKLYSEVEGASLLLGEAEIRAIAQELLLALPQTVEKDTKVIHSQTVDKENSMEMEYSVSKLSDTMLSFKMTPLSQYGMPESEKGEGYSIEYTDSADYSGTLNIMSSDRFLQSSVNSITYYSVMKLNDGTGVTQILNGTTKVTDSCEVNAK